MLSDDEDLAALALAADPDTPVGPDAVSVWEVLGQEPAPGLLPGWYMPPVAGGLAVRGWRRLLAVLVIAALVLISAYGLCNTYGQLAE